MDYSFSSQNPFLAYPYNQPNWNNLMEVIQNDNQQHLAGFGFAVVNDHLQPILDYLRQDHDNLHYPRHYLPPDNAPTPPALETPQPSPSVTPSIFAGNDDDGVIDLTMDDRPMVQPDAEIIDLTTTPPLSLEQDNSNTAVLAQNDTKKSSSNPNPCGYGHQSTMLPKDNGYVAKPSDSGSSCLTLMCPVCLDGFDMIKEEGQRQLMSTKCGHVFCSLCIQDILRQHKCCPTCRKPIRKVSLRPIYL